MRHDIVTLQEWRARQTKDPEMTAACTMRARISFLTHARSIELGFELDAQPEGDPVDEIEVRRHGGCRVNPLVTQAGVLQLRDLSLRAALDAVK